MELAQAFNTRKFRIILLNINMNMNILSFSNLKLKERRSEGEMKGIVGAGRKVILKSGGAVQCICLVM